jgi:hypothetical protein
VARFCSNCGAEVADLARFCSNCGVPLRDLQGIDSAVATTGTLEAPVAMTGPLTPIETPSVPGVAPGAAMLIIRRGPGEGTTFTLDSDQITVGRADDAALMLDDVTVSRRHAVISRSGGVWSVADAGSLNGTYVNRSRIDRVELAGGEEIQIGKYRFVFLVAANGQQ